MLQGFFKDLMECFFLEIKMPKKLFLNCLTLLYHFSPINIVLSLLWLFSDLYFGLILLYILHICYS